MDKRIRLDEAMVQMKDICQNRTNELNQRLEKLNAKLEALSPMKVLERGYVIVKESDKVFSSKVEILKAKPSSLSLQFFDGAVELKKVEIQANDD
jgi:exonuclease VII large subunit